MKTRKTIVALAVIAWTIASLRILADERKDVFGDPLPERAIARLGTSRLRNSGPVYAVAVSTDGKLLAYGGIDQETSFRGLGWSDSPRARPSTVTIWDLKAHRKLQQIHATDRAIATIQFSPDGTKLATIDFERMANPRNRSYLRLWQVDTGQEIKLRIPELGRARTLSFSPDGKTIAVALPEKQILLWDVVYDREMRSFALPPATEEYMVRIRISPNGQWLAAWDNVTGHSIWKVATGELVHTIPANARKFTWASAGEMVFAADSSLLVTVGNDLIARVCDTKTWRELRSLDRQALPITPLGILDDNRTLLIVDFLSGVSKWDLTTGKKIDDILRTQFSGALTGDGKTLIRMLGQSFEFFDAASGKPCTGVPGPMRPIESIAFHPDGKRVIMATDRPRLFDTRTGAELAFAGPSERCSFAAFAPDGRTILVATPGPVTKFKDGKMTMETPKPALRLLDATTGKVLRDFVGDPGEVEWIQFVPDQKSVLTYARLHRIPKGQQRERGVRVWDIASGREVRQLPIATAHRIAMSQDGRRIASSLNSIRLYDYSNRSEIGQLGGSLGLVYSIAVSESGRLVAAGAFDRSAKEFQINVWEAASLKPLYQWSTAKSTVTAIAIAPNERLLAEGRSDGSVRIWDLATGQQVRVFHGHSNFVSALAFAPDSSRVASGGADAIGFIWDVSELAKRPVGNLHLAEAELPMLWEDLLSEDPHKAIPASDRLTQSPGQSLPFMEKHLSSVPQVDQKAISRWIDELDSDQFKTRTDAERELSKVGASAQAALAQAVKNPRSPEQRRRLEALIRKLDPSNVPPPVLRLVRCVAILERVNTAESKKLIDILAGDKFDPRVVAESQSARLRLARAGEK